MTENESSIPPIFEPAGDIGGILFALLPCFREELRPLASCLFHITELTKLQNLPPLPSLSELTNMDFLFPDKALLQSSFSFYGKAFQIPLLATLASLLQGMKFYNEYKDLFPILFSGMKDGNGSDFSADTLSSLFSMFSGFSGGKQNTSAPTDSNSNIKKEADSSLVVSDQVSEDDNSTEVSSEQKPENISEKPLAFSNEEPKPEESSSSSFLEEDTSGKKAAHNVQDSPLKNSLISLLTPEQKRIYEQLMNHS